MNFIASILLESWHLLLEAAVYILFGILVGGLLKVFLSPSYVAKHLGQGRFAPVFKAALFGIPIPICSCGVLPAAASLKKQGANNGATTAFLISTPESGVDSISITYALLDPIMTVARPVAAFITAVVAGIGENLRHAPTQQSRMQVDLSCPVDNCCDGEDCGPEKHANHHSLKEKLHAGLKYAVGELWGDLAGWFLIGLLLGGFITTLVPDDIVAAYLGGGLTSMLLMLAIGIPLYICATASTPIAAALILKGISPGAALVFLLVGPATNITSLTMLFGLLGKRATTLYLTTIAVVSVACGLLLDKIYSWSGVSAQAVVGKAGEVVPFELQLAGAIIILALSVKPVSGTIRGWLTKAGSHQHGTDATGCGCAGGCDTNPPSAFPGVTEKDGRTGTK